MILRRLADAIRQQNWFTVFIELAIVIVGVYIGILVSDTQRQRVLHNDALASLDVLKDELQADIRDVENIVINYNSGADDRAELLRVLEAEEIDNPNINDTLQLNVFRMRLHFPNDSAYQTMRDGGLISQIRDVDLRQNLTVLMDREYERIQVFEQLLPESAFLVQSRLNEANWNNNLGEFRQDAKANPKVMINAITMAFGLHRHYHFLLESVVLPSMKEIVAQIDDYTAQYTE